MKLKKLNLNFDWYLIIIPILLAVAGLATIYSISSVAGKTNIFTVQSIFMAISVVVYIALMIFDYRELRTYSWYLFGVGIILLFLVGIFGEEIFGSRRWIDLGFTQFQPSELMKIIFLIFSAGFISSGEKTSTGKTIAIICLAAIPIFLILKQPDLGTTLTIISILVAVLIKARVSKNFVLIGIIILAIMSPFAWEGLKPYQKKRVATFFEPSSDPLGSGYNVTQSKIAVGSGGLFGRGFGQATQSQLQFIPVAHIDFIFSGWAEMTGFVGSSLMVVAFAILIWRTFAISIMAKDRFGSVFCFAAASMIFFQSFVNIGMNIGLMPVTGIPLPFVSYGGTSLVVTSAILGIVQSVYSRRKTLKFE